MQKIQKIYTADNLKAFTVHCCELLVTVLDSLANKTWRFSNYPKILSLIHTLLVASYIAATATLGHTDRGNGWNVLPKDTMTKTVGTGAWTTNLPITSHQLLTIPALSTATSLPQTEQLITSLLLLNLVRWSGQLGLVFSDAELFTDSWVWFSIIFKWLFLSRNVQLLNYMLMFFCFFCKIYRLKMLKWRTAAWIFSCVDALKHSINMLDKFSPRHHKVPIIL